MTCEALSFTLLEAVVIGLIAGFLAMFYNLNPMKVFFIITAFAALATANLAIFKVCKQEK